MFSKPSALALITASMALSATAMPLAPVYSDGLVDWVTTAQNGRSDLFLVGDSTVLTGGGWAFALNNGFANSSIGLAGTGLLSGTNENEGEGGGYFQISRNNEFGTPPPAGTGFRDIANTFSLDFNLPPTSGTLGDASTGQVSPFGITLFNDRNGPNNSFDNVDRFSSLGIEIDGVGISSAAAHTFTAQLAFDPTVNVNHDPATDPNPTASFQVVRRSLDSAGNQVTSLLSAPDGSDTFTIDATSDLTAFDFTFDADPTYTGPVSFTLLSNEPGLQVGGARVRAEAATGVTVSSWGYGGQSSRDFLNEQYLPLTESFRSDVLDQIVDGGSGELLVVITEGFNDLRDGFTPEEFVTNLSDLMDSIAADWVAGGNSLDDLNFLALGQYDTRAGIDDYNLALQEAALAEERLSFFDLNQITEGDTPEEFFARFDADALHFNGEGTAAFYGNALVTELASIPEPASLLLLTGGSLTLLARRRRRA